MDVTPEMDEEAEDTIGTEDLVYLFYSNYLNYFVTSTSNDNQKQCTYTVDNSDKSAGLVASLVDK